MSNSHNQGASSRHSLLPEWLITSGFDRLDDRVVNGHLDTRAGSIGSRTPTGLRGVGPTCSPRHRGTRAAVSYCSRERRLASDPCRRRWRLSARRRDRVSRLREELTRSDSLRRHPRGRAAHGDCRLSRDGEPVASVRVQPMAGQTPGGRSCRMRVQSSVRTRDDDYGARRGDAREDPRAERSLK
jgi:hypothetical protein